MGSLYHQSTEAFQLVAMFVCFFSDIQGVPKKRWISVLGSFLGGYMVSNQKVEENRPPLKFNFQVSFKIVKMYYEPV